MSYTPVATLVTEPQDSQKASTAALEFRTLKAYLADVILPLIGTKFGPTGGVVTGQFVSTNGVPMEVHADDARISFYNTAANLRTGYLRFHISDWVTLAAENSALGVLLTKAGNSVNFDGGAFFSSAAAALGGTLNRWGAYYGSSGSYTGTVTASAFVGDGSGLTGVPGASLTGGAIVAALGYTPYNASNPSGYQNTAGNVATASVATSAGVAAKAGTLGQNGSTGGIGMSFNWAAGAGGQPAWVWGSNDGANHNVWNPRNFVVAQADSATVAGTAGSATSVSGTGSNGYGNRTVSTSAPSGGADGDVWYQY